MPGPTQPRYASASHPRIAAIVKGLYRFSTHREAVEMLASIREQVTTSRESDPDDDTTCILWIRGFGLTNAEAKEGYTGHFGRVTIVRLGDTSWTLQVSKIPRDRSLHPQRRVKRQPIPNWGQTFLRSVREGKARYASEKEAWLALRGLQEQYPTATIPADKALYVQVYSRQYTPVPVRKFILEIKHSRDGYTIEARVNPHQKRIPRDKVDESYDDTLARL